MTELERAVRENAGPLLRGALALGLPPLEAEELAQETLVTFFESRERFEGRSSLRTYLFGILYNKARERARKNARELALDASEPAFEARFDAAGHWRAREPQGPEQAALSDEVRRLVAECADGLSPQQRAAFYLKEVEGAGSDEACNVLGLTSTHLRVLLFRARVALRECLERKWKDR